MSCLLLIDWHPGWKKMSFQLSLNKTFCPTPQPLIHRRLKHRQTLTKQCFLPPPHRISTQSSQYQNWEANYYSILTVFKLGLLLPESSCRIRSNLRPAHLLKKRLSHRCFPVNFAKFLRTPFLKEHLRWLLP